MTPTVAASRMGGWLHSGSLTLASVPPAPHTATIPLTCLRLRQTPRNVTFLSGSKQVTFLMAPDSLHVAASPWFALRRIYLSQLIGIRTNVTCGLYVGPGLRS